MIGILKIELPNDFKKGTEGCPLCHRLTCPINDEICSPRNCPLEIQEETEFTVNTEMFGRYCKIPTGFSKDMHIYKIVNMIESNAWMDVPITCKSEVARHETMEKVLNVIHCGVDETNVIRVALKDVEIIGE